MNKNKENIKMLAEKASHDICFLNETMTNLFKCANAHQPMLAMAIEQDLEQIRKLKNKIDRISATLQDEHK